MFKFIVAGVFAVAVTLGVVGGLAAAQGNTGNTAPVAAPVCHVTLSANAAGTQATATIVSGCVGSGFAFRSFVGQFTNDQFDEVTAAPWVVNLPPCAWQIDFSFMPGTPNHKLYANMIGGTGTCTTTTTTTTTTVPTTSTTTTPTTTPTTSTTIVTTPPTTPTTTPVTTLPPGQTLTTTPTNITAEQQQVTTSTPGVTNGNG